jgi:hypothetical protein
MNADRRHRITLNLGGSEYESLLELSRKNRVSLAWLGRQAIVELLDRYQSEGRQLPLQLSKARPKTNE